MTSQADLTVALAGNPNTGKSTVFNALTGLQQHVGNWPGKTVARREGLCTRLADVTMTVVDLPGTYSLSAYSPEEVIARDFILQCRPDVVVNVVDAANLERNLYLTVQLLELGARLVLAVNMVDVTTARGIDLDLPRLSRLLGGIPVLPLVARRGTGLDELVAAMRRTAQNDAQAVPFRIDYGREIEAEIAGLAGRLASHLPDPEHTGSPRWLAVKLLEDEADISSLIARQPDGPAILDGVRAAAQRLQPFYGEEVDIALTDQRYGYVRGVVRQVTHVTAQDRLDLTDRIDGIVTHRVLGIPFFLALMYLIFNLVQNVSTPYLDWVDAVFHGPFAAWAAALLGLLSAPLWLHSLVVDGILAGVGSVMAFIPGLLVLYLFLSLLEDSGYMARVAFVMDQAMSWMGLHGKSFVPLVLGFGCGVPAVYATRTLENRRDRLLTALLVPLMSCSARLPVYVVFGLAFFRSRADILIWGLYASGIGVAALSGLLLSRTILKEDADAAFILELPPYRVPTWHSIWIHMWRNVSDFVKKAGSLILVASMVIWLLLNLPWGVPDQEQSYFGRVSQTIAPVLAPAGFGHWDAAGALVTGVAAKEIVVSTLAQIYATGSPAPAAAQSSLPSQLLFIGRGFVEATLRAGRTMLAAIPGVAAPAGAGAQQDTALSLALQQRFTALSGLAYLVFVLLYVPCVATLAAIKTEFGWKWGLVSALYQTGLAYVLAVMVFQAGRLLGYG